MRLALHARRFAVAAAAATATAGLLSIAATAAQAAPAGPAQTSAHAAQRLDFRAPGIIIWKEPRKDSTRMGLGYPGQGFESDRVEKHAYYMCDNGLDTEWWYHGRNVGTGVTGWVPACNLTY
ncbi:hypothetical protein ACFY4C_14715 [Actinomadura viridis]|uniref:hypothetical protein n=1 Tax=Actinomadura viridis TaxID=58110 RepID=UPI0036ACF960